MEENHDISNSFWIEGIHNPDAGGNCKGNHFAGFEGRIKVSLGKPKRESGKHGKHLMMFKTVLPQHIFDKLNGLKIERSRGGMNAEVSSKWYTNMSKTVTSDSLEGLVKRYDDIVQDFLFILADEKAPKEKLIFVNWKSNFRRNNKSSQNSAAIGHSMSMEFHFFVGYFNGRSFFDIDHRGINTSSSSYEAKVPDYIRIPWTQEREDFFNQVFENLELFKDKLEAFFDTLNPDMIDTHIQTFKMLGDGIRN